MDGKNHILNPETKKLAAEFASFANEPFLVTFANKGLYKRALKDLEAVKSWTLEARENALEVTLDEIHVTLEKNLAQSHCSCPSKSVCKHLIMALLQAQAVSRCSPVEAECVSKAEKNTPQRDISSNDDLSKSHVPGGYDELKNADLSTLRKQAGKRLFEDVLKLAQEGWAVSFDDGEMLAAHIDAENITVYFPPEYSVSRSVCKCGASGLCRHKLLAILSYLEQRGSLKTSSGEQAGLINERLFSAMAEADRFLVKLLDKGLVCAGESDGEAAIQCAIHLETQGAGNLSRDFRRLSTDIENLLTKNAAFSQTAVFALLSRLHNTLTLLLKNPGNSELASALVENSRSSYYTTPSGCFLGLGAYPWQTKSGFFGITALLWHEEKQRLCTYTASMADYYEKTAELSGLENLTELLGRSSHWADGLSLRTISTCRLALGNFKINSQNRISSGKQTVCHVIHKTCLADTAPLPIAVALENLPAAAEEDPPYFPARHPEEAVILRVSALHNIVFDRVAQKLLFFFGDQWGRRVPGELSYTPLTEQAIQHLERLGRVESFTERAFVCLRRGKALIPVSILATDGVENFYFP